MSFVKPRQDGQFIWDPNEPDFSTAEISTAQALRENHTPDASLRRRDQCPHTPGPCSSTIECLEKIAWYLRYQREIEAWLYEQDRT